MSKKAKERVLFYEQDGLMHTLEFSDQKAASKKVLNHLRIKEGESFEVIQIKGILHIFFVDHENYICHCVFD